MCIVDTGFEPITMEQQLASDGQVTVMQAVPAGAGGQQVQVSNIINMILEKYELSVYFIEENVLQSYLPGF